MLISFKRHCWFEQATTITSFFRRSVWVCSQSSKIKHLLCNFHGVDFKVTHGCVFFHSVGCKIECHLRLMAYLLIPLSIWRYTRKRWGPRTNPFGTPVDSGTSKEILLLIFTAWVRQVRCDCTMIVLFYVSPTSFGSLSNKSIWSKLPNAVLRSIRTRGYASSSSWTSSTSASIRRMAALVLVNDLYTDCRLSCRPFLVRWLLRSCEATRSMTLLINGVF